MTDPKPGKYLNQIADLQDQGLFPPGTVTCAQIAHDDDCDIWSGKPCSCIPDIYMYRLEDES